MFNQTTQVTQVDYLVIGHVTHDITPNGFIPGGTVTYAALTAKALGMKVGILTSAASDLSLEPFEGIQTVVIPASHTTTFENIPTPSGRVQKIYQRATGLESYHIPEKWKQTPIVHFGPVIQEINPNMVRMFPESLVGLTIQGWLRSWNEEGKIHPCEWPEANFVLGASQAAVFSIEDILGDEKRIEEMVSSVRILAVTEGAEGARLYWNGDLRRFRPPQVEEVDAVGAGDIFAAAFFVRLYDTRDPSEAARFATQVAARSVTKMGIQGIPTPDEVQNYLIEIVGNN